MKQIILIGILLLSFTVNAQIIQGRVIDTSTGSGQTMILEEIWQMP